MRSLRCGRDALLACRSVFFSPNQTVVLRKYKWRYRTANHRLWVHGEWTVAVHSAHSMTEWLPVYDDSSIVLIFGKWHIVETVYRPDDIYRNIEHPYTLDVDSGRHNQHLMCVETTATVSVWVWSKPDVIVLSCSVSQPCLQTHD